MAKDQNLGAHPGHAAQWAMGLTGMTLSAETPGKKSGACAPGPGHNIGFVCMSV